MIVDLVKKALLIFASIFILVTLLYLAFYLFLVIIVIIGGFAIYAKIKGISKDHPIFKYATFNAKKSYTQNTRSRTDNDTEIIDGEYEEITTSTKEDNHKRT